MSSLYNRHLVTGFVAAVFTPLNKDGDINLDAVPSYAQWLKETGVTWVFVTGTTGESLSLSVEERNAEATAWVKHAKENDLRVIFHIGHDSMKACEDMATHAKDLKVDAVAAMPPVFFKPSSVGNLVETMGAVAKFAAPLPFYYYHIPSMTGVNFPMRSFLAEAADKIPNLYGVKFTDYDLLDFGNCVRYQDKRFNMLFGRDEMIDAGFLHGADGGVGSTYNYAGRLFNRLHTALLASDLETVKKEQSRAQQFIQIMKDFSADNVAANKAICAMVSNIQMGPPRLPQVDISDTSSSELRKALLAIGFFEWV